MSRLQLTLVLAGWEFRRFFKWRDELISLGLAITGLTAMAILGPHLMDAAGSQSVSLGLLGPAPFTLPAGGAGWTWEQGSEDELTAAYEAEELDGLVRFDSDTAAHLRCHAEGAWILALEGALGEARRVARMEALGIDPALLADLLQPVDLSRQVEKDEGEAEVPSASKWEKITAAIFVGLMFMGIMLGTALLFAGITSEKQQLVTEQVVAAVPPQTWIDGKILGLGARSLLITAQTTVISALGMWIWGDFVDPDFEGLAAIDWGLLPGFALLASLGFLLWFCFFAALAATIDDPNTSSRGMLLMVPILASLLAFPVVSDPTSALSMTLALFPATAPVGLTARMVLTEIAWWELPVAALGLILAIALLRRAAGKVFALGILMRGKEPTWAEMIRAVRQS
jgi:ABC-2 type transport system permease protein